MKNNLYALLIFLLNFAPLLSQQTDNHKILLLQKSEVYLSYNLMQLSSSPTYYNSNFSYSSRPFNEPYQVGEEFYYFRDKYKATHNFTTNNSIKAGIISKKPLIKSFSLYYGLGFNYQDIDYSNSIDTTTIAVRKATVIAIGESTPGNVISYETLVDDDSNIISLLGNSSKARNIKLFNLTLPIGIETKIIEKLKMKIGASLNVPIWSEVSLVSNYRILIFPGQIAQNKIEKNNSSIFFNNIIYSGDISLEYTFLKNIAIIINYNHGFNSITRDLSDTDFSQSFGNATKVRFNNFGLGFKYEF